MQTLTSTTPQHTAGAAALQRLATALVTTASLIFLAFVLALSADLVDDVVRASER
jgi:hypothetical protein